jgi:hypothetical protein
MAGLGNPLSSMNGAAGDLGLSQGAQDQAAQIAQQAKKKKLQDQLAMKTAGAGVAPSAFQALTGIGTP